MKRITLFLLAAALLSLPAVALARHGHHSRHHDRGLHRSHGLVGTITAYDEDSGDLTITTPKGREITALVTDDTRVSCSDDHAARASRHGGDDDNSGPGHDGDDDRGDDDVDDDDASPTATPDPSVSPDPSASPDPSVSPEPSATAEPEDDDDACELAEGVVVRRARIDLTEDDAVWTKLKLKG